MNSHRNLWPHWLLYCLVLLSLGFIASTGAAASEGTAVYGADANPTGEPIGGGEGYSRIITSGDVVVTSASELLTALAGARAGDVIYVAPNAEIDLTGERSILLKDGITLAGNRGENGAVGPLIYSNEMDTKPLFSVGNDVHIAGIRLRGPDSETQDSAYGLPNSNAIEIIGNNVEVDNCEIFNWSYAGVRVATGRDAYVHHNFIHHVQRTGLGYPVATGEGTALVEANIFDWYRHAIAGSGSPGSGYEARYNIVLEHAIGHAFDMHGGRDRNDGTEIAGERVIIHHNTFINTEFVAVKIRGIPQDTIEVYDNWFLTPSPSQAFYQMNARGNAWVYNNVYGKEKKLEELWPRHSSPWVRFGPQLSAGIAVVRGEVKLKVNVIPVPETELTSVRILLDRHTIYTGEESPGELVIDTRQLDDGRHKLVVRAHDDAMGGTEQEATFQVDNAWSSVDYLDAPKDTGWFGVVDTSKTLASSEGWAYATDDSADFFGDPSRKVRQADTTEYLVWEAPQLHQFTVVLYAKGTSGGEEVLRSVQFAVSTDGAAWQQAVAKLEAEETNEVGWTKVMLTGEVPEDLLPQQFKVSLLQGRPADSIQVGEVNLQGWK